MTAGIGEVSTSAEAGMDCPGVCIVGPLPPPAGGMANQCEQLLRLMRAEGLPVEVVRTNPDYHPAWVARVPFVRAVSRLIPYLFQLWRASGTAGVIHVLANSGWAWHLFAAPAVWIARLRGCPVIVNYRGGHADAFFARAPAHVLATLRAADLRVTPSAFLLDVFAKHGLDAEVVPNIIDLSRFTAAPMRSFGQAPHLIVTRNLEPIYDIKTAIKAFALVRQSFPGAHLTVAGSGPERDGLIEFSHMLGLAEAVDFRGRIDNMDIPALYASADCMLNPSTVDNMPISILEALASGVPVVSTDAGGIPHLVQDGVSALLVPVGDAQAMAAGALRMLKEREFAASVRDAGFELVQQFAWPRVRDMWLDIYRRSTARRRALA